MVTVRLGAILPGNVGSRIKNTRNGIFYRKRRSFLIEFMKRERVNEIRKRVTEAQLALANKVRQELTEQDTNTNGRQ